MHASRIAIVIAAVSLGAAPAFAQRGAPPQSHGAPPRAAAPQAAAPHGAAPAPTSHGNPHTTTTTKPAATSGKAPTTTTTTPPTLNPIAQKISSNPGLQPKMAQLLPSGMTLNQASLGFKNQGQFIAALHVSRNLGIPFADLKAAMTGIRPATGANSGSTSTTTSTSTAKTTMSLGQAIHKLRPSADADTATTTAVHQASIDQGTTTTTTTTATKKKPGK
jgi:hypothetical protein